MLKWLTAGCVCWCRDRSSSFPYDCKFRFVSLFFTYIHAKAKGQLVYTPAYLSWSKWYTVIGLFLPCIGIPCDYVPPWKWIMLDVRKVYHISLWQNMLDFKHLELVTRFLSYVRLDNHVGWGYVYVSKFMSSTLHYSFKVHVLA